VCASGDPVYTESASRLGFGPERLFEVPHEISSLPTLGRRTRARLGGMFHTGKDITTHTDYVAQSKQSVRISGRLLSHAHYSMPHDYQLYRHGTGEDERGSNSPQTCLATNQDSVGR
jgi:hypothetical protein